MSDARRAFDRLVSYAMCRTVIAYPDELRLEHARRDGKPIPEQCRPGYLLSQMNSEDREWIKQLTSDETRNYRPFGK